MSSPCVEETQHKSPERTILKRKIGLLGAIGLVMGSIIGAGIFISPKGIARASGSVGLSLVIWTIGGIIALFGALSLAELASVIPFSAGEYMYLRASYAKWVGFMYAWSVGVLTQPSSNAVIALTSANYLLAPIYNDGCGKPPEIIVKLLAVAIIAFLSAINSLSVSLTSKLQISTTISKVLALIFIICGGLYRLATGHTENLAVGFEGSQREIGTIIMGFYSAMWAYQGWNNICHITEEIVNPKRNIPLAFCIAVPSVTILYVLANVSYFTVMDIEHLIKSPAVAITWIEAILPQIAWLVPLCVGLSTFGACNGSILTLSRKYFVMAREREMPEVLSFIDCRRSTPTPAVVFGAMIAILYVFAGEVASLIDFLGFITWMFVAFIQLSVLVLRFKMKDAPRSYKVPLVFPVVVFLYALVLVVVPVVTAPQIEFLYAFLITVSGMVFYIPIVVFDKRPSWMRYFTQFCQLLMNVCPTTDTDDGTKTD